MALDINNPYAYCPNLDIDLEQIKLITLRNRWRHVDGLATHQRVVADEPYLVEVRKKYAILGELYNIYPTLAGAIVPIHIDHCRGCTLNFPIRYTEDSHTIFYEYTEPESMNTVEERIYNVISSGTKEVFRFTLEKPTLINSSIPHAVYGGPLTTRIVMSWSINEDFETAKGYFHALS